MPSEGHPSKPPTATGVARAPCRGLAKVGEVARYLRLSRATIYKLMNTGQLEYVRIGNSRRVHWRAVVRLVEQNTFSDCLSTSPLGAPQNQTSLESDCE